jgi:hypothetical protein
MKQQKLEALHLNQLQENNTEHQQALLDKESEHQ